MAPNRVGVVPERVSRGKDGRLREAFGTGTAAVISPVGQIIYKDEEYVVSGGEMGKISQRLYTEIMAIQYAQKEDPYEWIERIG